MNDAHRASAFGDSFFNVGTEGQYHNEAYVSDGPPADLFVFDDQLHIDFDAALRDPVVRSQMQAAYRSDGTHPNPLGRRAIANAVELALLETPVSSSIGNSGRCRDAAGPGSR